MTLLSTRPVFCLALLAGISTVALAPVSANAAEMAEIWDTIRSGEITGSVRYRYENVEENNNLQDGEAQTIRGTLGIRTGTYKSFQAMGEVQVTQHFGDETYNSLENGMTEYSTIADPDSAQVNRLWLNYSGLPQTDIKIGRQYVNMNNQRLVGSEDWRQNDQTFDALSISNHSIPNFDIQYTYIEDVNRVYEGEDPPDNLDSQTHLGNVSLRVKEWMRAAAYAYFMEFDNDTGLSNQTTGLRASGTLPFVGGSSLTYEAEYAYQSDYANNPNTYNEDYIHLSPALEMYQWTIKPGIEILSGDGSNAFQTPLGSQHYFNGWADNFLTTPGNGLEDKYLLVGYDPTTTGTPIDGYKFRAVYHSFSGEESGDYGREIDLSARKSLAIPDLGQPFKAVDALVKYADYDAEDAPYVDSQKIWVQLGVGF